MQSDAFLPAAHGARSAEEVADEAIYEANKMRRAAMTLLQRKLNQQQANKGLDQAKRTSSRDSKGAAVQRLSTGEDYGKSLDSGGDDDEENDGYNDEEDEEVEQYSFGEAIVAHSPNQSFSSRDEPTRQSKSPAGKQPPQKISSVKQSLEPSTASNSTWVKKVSIEFQKMAEEESVSAYRHYLPALATTLLVWIAYYVTAYPSLSGGDSGELIMTSCQLSMAHPPGYPTYTMVGWLFHQLFSFGNPARRMNILLATFGALAAGFIHLTVARLSIVRSQSIAALAAMGFAFSPTVWLYSIQGEVFAMNNFFCALLAYLTLRFLQTHYVEQKIFSVLVSESASASISPISKNELNPAVWDRILSLLMPSTWNNPTKRATICQNLESLGVRGVYSNANKGVNLNRKNEKNSVDQSRDNSEDDDEVSNCETENESGVLSFEGKSVKLSKTKKSMKRDSAPQAGNQKNKNPSTLSKKDDQVVPKGSGASKEEMNAVKDFAAHLRCLSPFMQANIVDVIRPHLEIHSEVTQHSSEPVVVSKAFSNSWSSWNIAVLGAFISGLSLTNQHTSLFYVLVTDIALLTLLIKRGNMNVQRFFALLGLVFLGMSPYIYLPLTASTKPFDGWGDQRTLSGFMKHFLRKEYGTFQLAADGHVDPGMISRLKTYLSVTMVETTYILLPLAFIGFIYFSGIARRISAFFKKENVKQNHSKSFQQKIDVSPVSEQWTIISFLAYCLYMFVFHYLANLELTPLLLGVQARFWQQANLYIFIWGALGLESLLLSFLSRNSSLLNSYQISSSPSMIKLPSSRKWVIASLAWVLIAHHVSSSLPRTDQSKTELLTSIGAHKLNNFPSNAIVLLNGDLNNNMVKYHQTCEKKRMDLRLISLQLMTWDWFVEMQARHYPGVVFPGNYYHPRVPGSFSIKQFFDSNYEKRPIFLCGGFKEGDDSWHGAYTTLPYGNCDQIVRVGKLPTKKKLAKFLRLSLMALPKLSLLGDLNLDKYTLDTWEYAAYRDAISRTLYLTSFVSFESNKANEPSLLKLAKSAMDYVFDPSFVKVTKALDLWRVDDLRAGGIIYGQFTRLLIQEKFGDSFQFSNVNDLPKALREKIAEAEAMMYYLWYQQDELTSLQQKKAAKERRPSPPDSDTKMFLTQKVNPYLSRNLLPEVQNLINSATSSIPNPFVKAGDFVSTTDV